jgi:Flp pilus assembly protein TadD
MLRAELLVDAGQCDRALPYLGRVIELAPRAATPRVALGTCHDDLGDPAAAERAFAGALSLHPHHPLALQRAGELYARYGRRLEARAMLTRFERSGYRDASVTGLLEQLERTDTW